MAAKESGVGRGGVRSWGEQVKLLYTERMNNKVLLYNTEDYIQYALINDNSKEYNKMVYICMMNHFAI